MRKWYEKEHHGFMVINGAHSATKQFIELSIPSFRNSLFANDNYLFLFPPRISVLNFCFKSWFEMCLKIISYFAFRFGTLLAPQQEIEKSRTI